MFPLNRSVFSFKLHLARHNIHLYQNNEAEHIPCESFCRAWAKSSYRAYDAVAQTLLRAAYKTGSETIALGVRAMHIQAQKMTVVITPIIRRILILT